MILSNTFDFFFRNNFSVYVKDSMNNTDVRIKDCYAYDNIKSAKHGIKPAQLQLTG